MERKFGRRYLNCDTKYIQWELRTVENFFSLIHKAIKFLIIKARIGSQDVLVNSDILNSVC